MTASAARQRRRRGRPVPRRRRATRRGGHDRALLAHLEFTRSHANGPHTADSRARDASGNTTTSAPLNVTVDNTGPPPPPGLVAAYGFDEGAGTAAPTRPAREPRHARQRALWPLGSTVRPAFSFDGTTTCVTVPDSQLARPDDRHDSRGVGEAHRDWNGLAHRALQGAERRTSSTRSMRNRNTSVPNGETHGRDGVPRRSTASPDSRSASGRTSRPRTTAPPAPLREREPGRVASHTTGRDRRVHRRTQIGGNTIWGEFFAGLIDEVRVYNRALTHRRSRRTWRAASCAGHVPPTVTGTSPAAGASGVDPGRDRHRDVQRGR